MDKRRGKKDGTSVLLVREKKLWSACLSYSRNGSVPVSLTLKVW